MNPSESIPELDLAAFPLHGLRLIEASAGTGKTYSIAALYVRLVLGHGRQQPLTPPDILVLTFTRAATQELRERIRTRLGEMARIFESGEHGEDAFVGDMLAAFPDDVQRAACARRLQVAAEWMDEAAIHTIHAWCQTMLRQHAFDSGSLFDQQVEAEDRALVAQAVKDYWRRFMYVDVKDAERFSEIVGTPRELEKKVRQLIKSGLEFRVDGQPATGKAPAVAIEAIHEWRKEVDERLQKLKTTWEAEAESAREFLQQAVENKFVNQPYSKGDYCQRCFEAIDAWRETPELVEEFEKLRISRIEKKVSATGKKQNWRPDHPLFAAIDETLDQLPAEPRWTPEIWPHAVEWIRDRYQREKLERNRLDFGDLLTQLDRALAGANGERLRRRILCGTPVALIDEFQDTDPVQYRIFERVFLPERDDPNHGLFLIGDPKQAIYSFRGADIHTYLAARRKTGTEERFTLPTNFRSTQAMVDAVNGLFEVGDRQPNGAFGFGADSGNPVPFHRVEAHGRDERFGVAEAIPRNALPGPDSEGHDASLQTHPALTLWYQPPAEVGGTVSNTAYQSCMAKATAAEITRLLNLGRSDPPQAGFIGKDGATKAVKPSDMAVLVSARYEADAVQRQLRRRGVDSVYLSERNSIFDQPEAADLVAILEAAASPADVGRVRNALAVPSLCATLEELDELNRDEERLEEEVRLFMRLEQTWSERGVLAMLRSLFTAKSVPARLLGRSAGGERALTNLLHLAELLQAESEGRQGERGLIDYLRGEVASTERSEVEEQVLRLESDADLVRIITIFKAKGLQYPLVFVPFPCNYKVLSENDQFLEYHERSDEHSPVRVVELAGGADAVRRAQAEKLQEQLRLFYVALTRSEHACWVGLAPVLPGSSKAEPDLSAFAPGHLLLGLRTDDEVTADETPAMGDLLQRLKQDHRDISVIEVDPESVPEDRLEQESATHSLGPAAEYHRKGFESWWIASYSALRYGKTGGDSTGSAVEANLDEMSREDRLDEDLSEPFGSEPEPGSIHAFPRGAKPGNFLHLLLEWAAREGFGRVLDAPDQMRQEIALRLERHGWGDWTDAVTTWFETQLTVPMSLGDAELPLVDLPPDSHRYQPELEFWLEASRVDVRKIDDLVSRHTLDGRGRSRFQPNRLNGMLHGFIDLVFEHEGRWYVADYKSSWIGPTAAWYTHERMSEVVLEHRYDMQYVLYTLALHRLLKSRLGTGYKPGEQLGGAAYLFLRGCENPETAGVFFEPASVELIEDIDRLFAGQEVADVA